MPQTGKGAGPGDDGGDCGRGTGEDGPDEKAGSDEERSPASGGERGSGGRRGRRRGRRRRPERWQEVEALVRRLEPEIVQVFRRHRLDPHVASLVLEEVVTLLLYRWRQIARPETWVLEMLERRIESRRR